MVISNVVIIIMMCFIFLMGVGVGHIIREINTQKRINKITESCKRLDTIYEEPSDIPEAPKVVDRYDMTAEVDFKKLNVFSVERARNGDTILGYWKEKVVNGILIRESGEWHLSINDEQHLRFVEELKDQIKETENSINKVSS